MRVAWLFEYPTLNGGEQSLLATLPHLRERGIDPVAIAPPTGRLAEALHRSRVGVTPFECTGAGITRPDNALLRTRLAEILATLGPALLHANSLSMGRLSGPVAQELGLPSVAHLRDMLRLSANAATDLNRHRRLLAVSAAVRDWHVAQGLEPERTHVLHNGVDLIRFQPRGPRGTLHARLGIDPAAPLIGTIGQLGMRKGLDVLVRALALLAAREPAAHMVFAGERYSQKSEAIAYEARLHADLNAAGWSGRAHFLGWCEPIEEFLPELSLLVHPARQEPLGRVLLEGAACGVAIVATHVGGTLEIFPPGSDSAWLVPRDDPAALAVAIETLLAMPRRRAELGRAARERAVAAFDARRAGETLADHYAWVANHGTTGAAGVH